MTETYGWVGKILRVDLSGGIWEEDTMKYAHDYLGGRGIAAKIAWNEITPEVGPYDPENRLMFMSGTLTGTLAPTSGRALICAISPRVYPKPLFTRSGIGGYWAPELKYAGFDGIVVQGKAEKPVYLWINDGEVELKEAKDLWGKGAISTQILLKNIHGKDAQVLAIGPAGENLVRWATIQHNLNNAAGQAGFGAVMGSKKLKAIVIKGTRSVKIARTDEFLEACKYVEELIRPGPTNKAKFGDPVPPPTTIQCSHACPVNCCPKIRKHVPATIGYGVVNMTPHCNDAAYSAGFARTEYPTKYIKDTYTGDIYTRPTRGFGDIGIELQALGEDLGLSGWNYINLYVWFGACVDNGITELNGYKIDPDNPRWWYTFLRQVAHREGLGDLFADGLIRAVEKLDIPEILKKVARFQEPAYGFSAHRLGRGAESQPSPTWIFSMLLWITDTRDPQSNTHQSTFTEYWLPPHHGGICAVGTAGTAGIPFDKLKATFKRVFGTGEVIEPGFEPVDAKVKAAIWHQHRSVLKDSISVCDWCFPRILRVFRSEEEFNSASDYYGDIDAETKLFNPATGLDLTTSELEKICEKIFNLERALVIRNCGRSRETDSTMEWLFEYPEKSDGTKLDKAIFNRYLDEYYTQRGWDVKTGWPTRAKLKDLGLKDAADELGNCARRS